MGAVAVDLSVVVPVFDEAGSIEALVRDLEHEIVPLFETVEVIVIDDASTDSPATGRGSRSSTPSGTAATALR